MLSIGGIQEITLGNQDDPWTNGLGIFDMTALNWTNAYDAAAPAYERPSLVSQFYANNSRYPIEWGGPELESIFNSSSNSGGGDNINNTGPGITPKGIANVSGGTYGGTGVTGRIVGGVIGGMLGCMIIIFSLIFWRRRRQQIAGEVALAVGRRVFDENFHELPVQLPGASAVHEVPGASAVHEVPGASAIHGV